HDFDQNGSLDIVLGYYDNGTCYPVRGRQCSSDQMPFIKDKFPTYNAFAQASTQDIYGSKLNEALNYRATNFASVYVENLGNGKFNVSPLPTQVQLAMVNSVVSGDFNNDGIYEAILAGNLYGSEVETPRSDGSIGSYLTFDSKKNQWKYQSYNECGLSIQGNTKNMAVIQSSKGPMIVAGKNNTQPQIVNVVK
ncbi:MAG: hypothetical protein ACPGEG_05700, partial [Salibacteraceae bacterium]